VTTTDTTLAIDGGETVTYGEEFVAAVHQHLLIDPFAG
jgi:hypothetical protein